jgi:hypothetical protein
VRTVRYPLTFLASALLVSACSVPKALRPNTWTGLFGLVHLIVFIWAVVDIIGSEHKSTGTKVLWMLVVLFFPLVGLIFYIVAGRDK